MLLMHTTWWVVKGITRKQSQYEASFEYNQIRFSLHVLSKIRRIRFIIAINSSVIRHTHHPSNSITPLAVDSHSLPLPIGYHSFFR